MRRDDGRVIPNFIAQALASEALTLYGDGNQTRSFCYVADLIEVRAGIGHAGLLRFMVQLEWECALENGYRRERMSR